MTLASRIEDKLRGSLAPSHLVVDDESHMHSVPKDAETHFKVLIVSEAFVGLGRVDRHRRVNEVLKEQFAAGMHALSLRALTAEEAVASGLPDFVSPPCLGGSKKAG